MSQINLPSDWTDEGSGCKDGDCNATFDRTPDICKRASYDCEWCTTSQSLQEAANHNRFNVLSNGDRNLEDGKDEEAREEGDHAAK